jgi:transcription initiation factor TFIIH subunit 2
MSTSPPPDDTARPPNHAWEAHSATSHWADVLEDSHGNLLTSSSSRRSIASQIRRRRHRLASSDGARREKRLARHMLRHVYLVLDCSRWSREKDSALNNKLRLESMMSLSVEFVKEYYDQNPLGHLGVVLVREGEAEMLTTLGGSPKRHVLALNAALVSEMKRGGKDDEIGGEFSLQNGIEVAGRSLGYAPRYGSREIIVLTSALATCDPGDILGETLPRLKHANIRVSSVSMQAEMHVCKRLAEETGGLAGVCLDGRHLRDLIMGHAIPPPVSASHLRNDGDDNNETTETSSRELICEFVTMGFPSKDGGDVPTLVHSTGGGATANNNNTAFSINPTAVDDRRNNRLIAFARTGYVCPRCRSRCSDLPSDCAVCGLRLILAPHLARTFHHLFPVRLFEELEEALVVGAGANGETENDGDVTMSNANGETSNGTKGLDALPVVSSSAFTPIASDSSLAVTSFVVSSSTNNNNESMEAPHNGSQNNRPTSNTKIINIGPSLVTKSTDCDRCCFGCLKIIGCKPIASTTTKNNGDANKGETDEITESILRFQCPECGNVFCPDCDAYLHETLHNCPGCLCN